MIYLASPYSHPDPAVREARFQAVCRVASRLARGGLILFSPIAHSHPIALAGGLPGDWEFWREFGRRMIQACDEVWIVKLPGWDASTGIKAEIDIGQELGRPVIYIEPRPGDLGGLKLT